MGGTTAEKFIGQMIDKVADRSNVKFRLSIVSNETLRQPSCLFGKLLVMV